MFAGRMHVDEVDTNAALAGRLLAAQFPQWAELPVTPVHSAGTDNAIYRLGDDMTVRLPRIPGAVEQVEKEHRWLPRLAPLLPLAVPVPLGKGTPAEGYPWPGPSAVARRRGRNRRAHHRSTPCGHRDGAVRRRLAADGSRRRTGPRSAQLLPRRAAGHARLPGPRRDRLPARALDAGAATAVWEAALRAPAWRGPPVWIHGDLHAGNLLARQGRLSAVIDFGGLGVVTPRAT